MQCKSRKLKLLQNEAKCIVLKVKPRFFLVPGDTIGFLCKQKSWAILSLKNIPNRFLGQTFLWARAEVDKSAAWRNLEQNNFEMNLKKIKVWRKNHLWHQQPNLPPCVAHPAQHPPGWRDNQQIIQMFWQSYWKTYFRPGCSCLNWTTVMVKTHFSLFLASSAAW